MWTWVQAHGRAMRLLAWPVMGGRGALTIARHSAVMEGGVPERAQALSDDLDASGQSEDFVKMRQPCDINLSATASGASSARIWL